MNWYAVIDADQNWDTDGVFIALAETPEDAARQALAAWKEPDDSWEFDNVQVKVAELRTVGFQSFSVQAGKLLQESFIRIENNP